MNYDVVVPLDRTVMVVIKSLVLLAFGARVVPLGSIRDSCTEWVQVFPRLTSICVLLFWKAFFKRSLSFVSAIVLYIVQFCCL